MNLRVIIAAFVFAVASLAATTTFAAPVVKPAAPRHLDNNELFMCSYDQAWDYQACWIYRLTGPGKDDRVPITRTMYYSLDGQTRLAGPPQTPPNPMPASQPAPQRPTFDDLKKVADFNGEDRGDCADHAKRGVDVTVIDGWNHVGGGTVSMVCTAKPSRTDKVIDTGLSLVELGGVAAIASWMDQQWSHHGYNGYNGYGEYAGRSMERPGDRW